MLKRNIVWLIPAVVVLMASVTVAQEYHADTGVDIGHWEPAQAVVMRILQRHRNDLPKNSQTSVERLGNGQWGIIVEVEHITPNLDQTVPDTIEGVPVELREKGTKEPDIPAHAPG